jgi:hypothetical protein
VDLEPPLKDQNLMGYASSDADNRSHHARPGPDPGDGSGAVVGRRASRYVTYTDSSILVHQ